MQMADMNSPQYPVDAPADIYAGDEDRQNESAAEEIENAEFITEIPDGLALIESGNHRINRHQ